MRVKTRWSCCCSPINQSIIASSRDLEVATQGPSYWSPSAWFEIQSSLLSPFVTFPDPKTSHGHNVVTRCCRLQGDWFLLLASKSICRICGTLRSVDEITWSSGQSAEAYIGFWGWQQVFEASMANWRRVKVEEKQRRGWWTSSWAGPGVAKGDWWNKNFQTFLNLSFWNNVQSFTNSFCSFEPALWCQRGDGM